MILLFSNKVSKAFADKVISISNDLSIDSNWLMFLMDWESGIDSSRENPYGCLGLIQFCPDHSGGDSKTIGGVVYKLSDIKAMDPVRQLNLVDDYLREVQSGKGKFSDYYQLYLAILFPEASGKPDNYVLNTKTNSIFDLNKDGKITVGEVKAYLDSRVKEKVTTEYWPLFFKKKVSFGCIEKKSYSGELLLH